MSKNECVTCALIYSACTTCNKATHALFWRSKCCSVECFIAYMDMMEGENMSDIQIMLQDKKTYLIEKINKKSIKLKHIDKTIKLNEIKAITYCPIGRLHELAVLFTTNNEEVIDNE